MKKINIAITGCGHGELDTYYRLCDLLGKQGTPIDLLIITGDFQAVRNQEDLGCKESPQKYKLMRTFYRYYNGEKKASVLTIYIGGNHEAVNYHQELYYGGWVAPNIYYMGASNVLHYKGLKIGGISGIYKAFDYHKGYFEAPPYTSMTSEEKVSSYHLREIEVRKMFSYPYKLDIMLSHDWPEGIYNYGDRKWLSEKKSGFVKDMEEGALGSVPYLPLLKHNKPRYWFASHMHVKFTAIVPHDDQGDETTKFLALDKCLAHRDYFQVLPFDIDDAFADDSNLYYDPEWLMIVKEAQAFLSTSFKAVTPSSLPISQETRAFVEDLVGKTGNAQGVAIPKNFVQTAPLYFGSTIDYYNGTPAVRRGNNQTDAFLSMLGLSHVLTIPYEPEKMEQKEESETGDPNALDLDD